MGPGLLESVYETCLCHELQAMGLEYERQKNVPVSYKGLSLESGLRLDILVEDIVIIELKCVEKFAPIHESQLLTYIEIVGEENRVALKLFYCAND